MTEDELAHTGADERRTAWIAKMVGVCLAGVLVLGLLTYALWHALDLGDVEMSLESVEALIRSWGMWGAAASIAIMILHSFVPLPAEIIAMANGMVFGKALGIALTWTGAMLGAIISFALARWLGQPLAQRLVPARHWDALQSWEADQGAAALLIARLIPVVSFNLINYAAGVAGVRWPVFLWTTAIGILPLTVLSVVLGHQLVDAPLWVWGAVAVGLVALWFGSRRFRRPAES